MYQHADHDLTHCSLLQCVKLCYWIGSWRSISCDSAGHYVCVRQHWRQIIYSYTCV